MDLKRGSGTSDPYLKCVIMSDEADWAAKTKVKANAKNAKGASWKQPLRIDVPSAIVAHLAASPLRVRILVWDKDYCKDDDFIGRVETRLHAPSGTIELPLCLGPMAAQLLPRGAVHPTLCCQFAIESLGVVLRQPDTETGMKELMEM